MIKKRLEMFLVAAALVFAGAGCGIYRLGTTLPPHLKTISVATFDNKTGEPQIETTIANAVIQEFQREGQLAIDVAESADIIMTGTLQSYRLTAMRFDSNNPNVTREYRAEIKAEIEAKERLTGKKLIRQVITGYATLPAQGDLVTARRNVLPTVALDLAHEAVNAVVSAW